MLLEASQCYRRLEWSLPATDRIWGRGRTRLAWRCQSPGKPRASCFPKAHSEYHPPSPIELQCVVAEVEGLETQWHP